LHKRIDTAPLLQWEQLGASALDSAIPWSSLYFLSNPLLSLIFVLPTVKVRFAYLSIFLHERDHTTETRPMGAYW